MFTTFLDTKKAPSEANIGSALTQRKSWSCNFVYYLSICTRTVPNAQSIPISYPGCRLKHHANTTTFWQKNNMSEARHGSTPRQRTSRPYNFVQRWCIYRRTILHAQDIPFSHPGCTMTIRRILLKLSTQNTTPWLDILLCQHNILLDSINQYSTSLYIGEQCTTIKIYCNFRTGW